MKDLPRPPRRVAQTHAVAEKQKYLAVPDEDERVLRANVSMVEYNGPCNASKLDMDEDNRARKRTKFGSLKSVYPAQLMKGDA